MAIPSTIRVQKHRKSLRAAGLRPIQLWVPDTRNPKFAAECHRQSLLLTDDQNEKEIMDWCASVSDTEGWV